MELTNTYNLCGQFKPVQKISKPPTSSDSLKKTDDKNWLIMGAIGIAAVGGLIAAEYKSAMKLPEKIDFIPAKTLDEAKEFARKNLHIQNYTLKNLDCANYVNEALVDFNNTSSTHRALVHSVGYYDGDKSIAEIISLFKIGYLYINEKYLAEQASNFEEDLSKKDVVKNIMTYGSDSVKELYSRFKKGEELSFSEKINLANCVDIAAGDYSKTPTAGSYFAQAIANKDIVAFLKKNNLPYTLKEYMKYDKDKRLEIVKTIRGKYGSFKYPDTGKFGIINHELGHHIHKMNVGSKAFNATGIQNGSLTYEELINATINQFKKDPFGSTIKMQTIGFDAAREDREFVAETFALLKNGGKICDELMEYYKKLGGVLPEAV